MLILCWILKTFHSARKPQRRYNHCTVDVHMPVVYVLLFFFFNGRILPDTSSRKEALIYDIRIEKML